VQFPSNELANQWVLLVLIKIIARKMFIRIRILYWRQTKIKRENGGTDNE